MAGLSIRDLDDRVKERLRVRAAQNGRSMEAEVRAVLAESVGLVPTDRGLATTLLDRFARVGGVDLEIPPRTEAPRSARLEP